MTPNKFIRTLSILFLALLGGISVFAAITIAQLLTSPGEKSDPGAFTYVVPVILIACVLLSTILFKNNLKKINPNGMLRKKLEAYQQAYLMRLALLEGAGLFAITVLFITRQDIFLWYAVIAMLIMIINRPVPARIAIELQLNDREKRQLEDGDKEI